MEPGIFEGLDINAYHEDPALSSSGLREFMKTPQHYWFRYIGHPEAYKPKPHMVLGRAVHAMVLEGEEQFMRGHAYIKGMMDKRSGKWDYERDQHAKHGIQLLTEPEFWQIHHMANRIAADGLASSILQNGKSELSHFAVLRTHRGEGADRQGGEILAKARPDFVIHGDLMADYKTVTGEDLGADDFGRGFFGMKNHVQGQFHRMVVEEASGKPINHIVYIAQMQEPPYLVRVFAMEEEHINQARLEIDYYLPLFIDCWDGNIWPGYPQGITSLVMPSWYGSKIEG